MNLDKLISGASRLFFLGAFLLLALAVFEKIANAGGLHNLARVQRRPTAGFRGRSLALCDRDEDEGSEQRT